METPLVIHYVVGFMFSASDHLTVALIKKNKPDWQRGKLNGIGGKIEEGEQPILAQVREFWEEAAVVTQPEDWNQFAVLTGPGWSVTFYYAEGDLAQVKAKTDEQILLVNSEVLPSMVIPNLRFLIPLARLNLKGEKCMTLVEYPQ